MRILVIIFLTFFFSFAYAGTWVSPIDRKYQENYPDLFEKFVRARDSLDKYRGNREDLIQAKMLLDEILSQEEYFAPAYREYGRLFMKAGHISYGNFHEGALGSAESAILESVKIEPEYADAYVLLGHLYTRNTSTYQKAAESLQKAEAIGTELPWLHLNYADLLEKLNREDESLSRYMVVVNSETDNRNAYSYALSKVSSHYRNSGNYTEAEKWYKKSAEFDNSAWEWGEYSIFLLFWVGDIDRAIDMGEKAISIMPYGIGKFNLACAYYAKWADLQNTDPKAAEVFFEKGAQMSPITPKLLSKMQYYAPTQSAATKLAKRYSSNLTSKN